MLNRAVLVGRLTRDPESQYTPSGVAIAKFTVAVDRFSKNPETGEKETDFIPVVAFRRSAEFVTQYITKGRLVAVEGRIQVRSWVAQDGQKRYMTEIIADNVQGLDRARDGEGAPMGGGSDYGDQGGGGYSAPSTANAGAPAANAANAARRPAPPADDLDESDPFADE
jgi:single-strand DNA-binding protein